MPLASALIVGGSIGLGDIGASYLQGQSAKNAQSNAQSAIQHAQEQAIPAINNAYNNAEGEYSLINNVIQNQYSNAGQNVTSGYQGALTNTASGYGSAINTLQPYATSGYAAQNEIANLNGLNGSAAQQAAMQRFQTDPGYQFMVNQANQALSRSALSQGNIFSGNFGTALMAQNQGMASQEYNNYYNRLMGVSNAGQSAAGGISAYQAGQGNALAGLDVGQGSNLANINIGQAGAQSNAYQNLAAMQANQGLAAANVYTGTGSQLAGYGYAGQMAQGNAYAQGISGLGTAIGAGMGQYNTQQSINAINGLTPSGATNTGSGYGYSVSGTDLGMNPTNYNNPYMVTPQLPQVASSGYVQ